MKNYLTIEEALQFTEGYGKWIQEAQEEARSKGYEVGGFEQWSVREDGSISRIMKQFKRSMGISEFKQNVCTPWKDSAHYVKVREVK